MCTSAHLPYLLVVSYPRVLQSGKNGKFALVGTNLAHGVFYKPELSGLFNAQQGDTRLSLFHFAVLIRVFLALSSSVGLGTRWALSAKTSLVR